MMSQPGNKLPPKKVEEPKPVAKPAEVAKAGIKGTLDQAALGKTRLHLTGKPVRQPFHLQLEILDADDFVGRVGLHAYLQQRHIQIDVTGTGQGEILGQFGTQCRCP